MLTENDLGAHLTRADLISPNYLFSKEGLFEPPLFGKGEGRREKRHVHVKKMDFLFTLSIVLSHRTFYGRPLMA